MATGDSQLSNSARLLAAQEFNRRALQKKAQEKLAKIEAERQKDLAKTTRRLEEAKLKARNEVERRRIQDAINEQLAKKSEQARRDKINAEAQVQAKKAIARVVGGTGTNIETLSGRLTIKDTSGKIVGLSNTESATSVTARKRIITEIARREEERKKVTDLERFLINEQNLAQGNVSRSDLLKQIADRKRQGLSKTPQQKLALQRSTSSSSRTALSSRQQGKPAGITGATFGQTQRESARSSSRASNFTNTSFISGGTGAFGARQKDNSLGQISSQLAFLQKRRTSKSSNQKQNEIIAQQIAGGNFFSNLSSGNLSTIISAGFSGKARSAKEQKAGVKSKVTFSVKARQESSVFGIVAQQDIPDPVTGITDRQVQVFRSELKARGEPVPDTASFFSGGRAPRANDPFNSFTFGNFGGVDTTKIKKRPKATQGFLGLSIFSDTQTQSDIDRTRKSVERSGASLGSRPSTQKAKNILASSKRRAGDFGTFSIVGTSIVRNTPAPLSQSNTKQFGSLNLPVEESQRQVELGIPFQSAFADGGDSIFAIPSSQSSSPKTKKGKSKKPRASNQTSNIFDLSNLINENISGVASGVRSSVSNIGSSIDNIFANPTRNSNAPLPTISDSLNVLGGGSGNIFNLNIKGVSNRDVAKSSLDILNPFK